MYLHSVGMYLYVQSVSEETYTSQRQWLCDSVSKILFHETQSTMY